VGVRIGDNVKEENMQNFTTILPATALVAILLFVAREVLEFRRRKASDKRKVSALKTVLARECELNHTTISSLIDIFTSVDTIDNPNPDTRVTIERTPSGRPYARIESKSAGGSQLGIPEVHKEIMAKVLLEVASADRELFETMEPAYDGLAEVEHVRQMLVNIDDAPQAIGPTGFLEGLAGYALRELPKTLASSKSLYLHCTGKELTKFRLR
jgi:hypothetical protein